MAPINLTFSLGHVAHRNDSNSPFERRLTVVAEGLITLPNGLLEADLHRALLKRVSFFRMARDAVEYGADELRCVQTLGEQRLVQEQFHHHELIDGHAR